MKRLVLFDLDGTLMDTSHGIIRSIEYTLNEMNIPRQDDLKKYIGPPIEYSFREYAGLSSENAEKAAKIFRQVYPQKFLFEAEIYPGMTGLLEELRSNDLKIGIATFKRESYTMDLLEHFKLIEKFDVIHGSDEFGKLSKTDIIRLCMDETHCADNETIMIGDTKHDASAARMVHIDFVAVTYGFGFKTKSEISDNPCLHICENSKELYDFLLALN